MRLCFLRAISSPCRIAQRSASTCTCNEKRMSVDVASNVRTKDKHSLTVVIKQCFEDPGYRTLYGDRSNQCTDIFRRAVASC